MLKLQINGGNCTEIEPSAPLPLLLDDRSEHAQGQLSERQAQVHQQISRRLAKLKNTTYRGQLVIPITDGQPGEPGELPRVAVYPAGTGKR